MNVSRWILRLWQQMKKHRLLTIEIIVVLIIFILAVSLFGWTWTGFNGGFSQTTTTSTSHGITTAIVQPPVKSLWDWLQLLIVPIILAVGGFWLNQIQKRREENRTEHQAKTEQDIVLDNQREAALQSYIDTMSGLYLHEQLIKKDEVRIIARVQTVTVLPRLDGKRKGSVLLFLSEANLIKQPEPTIAFGAFGIFGADLSEVDLSGIHRPDLSNICITYAILDRANFTRVFLRGAIFEGSHLCEARLIEADLTGAVLAIANLRKADLTGAILIKSNLEDADLTGAILEDADLTNATITNEQLAKVGSLQGTIMPDGTVHP